MYVEGQKGSDKTDTEKIGLVSFKPLLDMLYLMFILRLINKILYLNKGYLSSYLFHRISSLALYVFSTMFFSYQLGVHTLTVTSPPEVNVSFGSDSPILLNCSFEKETGKHVNRITWSKKNETEDKYITIIEYYLSYAVYLDPDMKNRSNCISFDDSSPSAILNISEVQCKDDGQYRCFVEYINSKGNGIRTSTETNVYIQGKNVYKEL